ncbi:hypothetical protein CSW25_08930 [Thermus scotoductus]|uniref:Uncharacterized protein n=2 Tax=Thermus scotoductus TaxID=37636 RepID=A0A430VM36_THESC|nr:hypothetical protein [Thermus scotoductus]RTG95328.1 hypothetical protein CSW48_06375 [Thermus scotoductus]RTH10350.1 hypothetical protein CSW46_06705 [Thermus scotoductus]RTH11410.1 hypothetical protein CSW44_05835 [Thermus scotoductus]RTH12316.1 hypothetical protein CSW43_05520 [Thermus scotoductus]RTH18429.1 hypothetical protein CSW39_05225 [Thermus scotoductus]
MRKPFGLWALLALLSGLALAQNTDSHTVTVKIPPVLQLSLDATDYLFDFTDATLQGTETVTVGNTPYTKASLAAYLNFLDSGGLQDFAPTSLGGTTNAYGTVTVLTNRGQWTVKIDSIGGTLTLGNGRVKVFAEKVSGKGSSLTSSPTSIASGLSLFGAGSVGQGKSVYKLYYLFTMDISDDIPLAGLNESITLNLLLSSP